VSSQAKISQVERASNYLRERSPKLPIGVGIITRDPLYDGFYFSPMSTVSLSKIEDEKKRTLR
jgi:hypothetical protein